jgi:arylformamidase
MRYFTLSYTLKPKSPVYKGLETPLILPKSQLESEGYNTYLLTIENHSGTHVDAPGHFIGDGRQIDDYSIEEMIYNHPLILDCPKNENELIKVEDLAGSDLEGVDCLFIRTGFGKYRETDPEKYLTQNPGIAPEAVHWIRVNFWRIRCLGMDCVSISGFHHGDLAREAHLMAFQESLGEPLILVEDLKLESAPTDLEQVIIVPWQVGGIDSAPCTVIASVTK